MHEGNFQSSLDPLLDTVPAQPLPDQMDARADSRSVPTTWFSHPDDCSDRYIPRRPSVSASMHQMEPSAYPVDDCIDYWSGRLRFGLALRGVVYILRFLSQHALNFVVGGVPGCYERCDDDYFAEERNQSSKVADWRGPSQAYVSRIKH